MIEDVRWQQRFNNYKKALNLLEEIMTQTQHTAIEKEGAIQRFEYTYELAWLTLKDYLFYDGVTDLGGSRGTFKEAFHRGLIDKPEVWTEMIKSRQLTSHSYNEATANYVFDNVKQFYLQLFIKLRETFYSKMSQ